MKKLTILGNLAASVLALTFGIGSASADIIGFDLSASNLGAGFTGPFVHVTVNQTSTTTANITFDSLTNGGNIYLMGSNTAAAVNVNATTWGLSNLAGTALTANGFSNGALSNGGAANANGFGSFNQTIDNFNGFTSAHNQISFTLTNTSGTWGSASAVLAANALGNTAASHIFACAGNASTCLASAGAAATGYATVPIPAAVWLLGSGLAGVFTIARRKSVTADLAA